MPDEKTPSDHAGMPGGTASEARYRAVFEHCTDAMLLTALDGRILSVNTAACQLFGYTAQELLTRNVFQLLDAKDPDLAPALARRAANGEMTAELCFVRRGGAHFDARLASKLFQDDGGQQMASMIVHDISDRKHAEAQLRESEQRFRLLYENAPIGIGHIDLDGNWIYVNRAFVEIAGYPPEELIGRSNLELAPPGERERSRHFTEQLLAGAIEIQRDRRLLRKDGSTRWIRLTAKMLRDDAGQPLYGIILFLDITDAKHAEEALRQSEERFRSTFEHAPLGIAECAADGRFVAANTTLLAMLGYSMAELETLSNQDITHPADQEVAIQNFHKLLTGQQAVAVAEQRYLRKDRSQLWVNVTVSLRGSGDGPHLLAIVEDVTARKKAEEALRGAVEYSYHLASHDTLTGLANRAHFNERLKDALKYAQRDQHLVAVHVLDLDRFKSINDTLGHHAGDLLLKEVARRLGSLIRETDLAARLGGDEFVVVQTHLADAAAAEVLAEKIVVEMSLPYLLDGHEVYSGTSIGIALYPSDAHEPGQLVKLADLALYEAKNQGRLNYQMYRESLGTAAQEAKRFERELQRALREEELCLHYQPQYDLDSGRIVGIDALIRWHHPDRGLLTAASFIQEVENANLMLPVGEWALRTACTAQAGWVRAGLVVPLTLNVSSKQVRHPRFLTLLNKILEDTGLPPSLLRLEMRESVLLDPKFSANMLGDMHKRGVRLGLDDFGAELAALSSLQKFPLDIVKPGQELVRRLSHDENESAILSALVGVARDARITVCADGIETAEQLAVVRSLGVNHGQGYLLSPPLSAADMDRLVAAELGASPAG
ncbi:MULTISPECIES: PAS domain S-box protein [unclassified Massilia]|uniref:sensor domain-containing protein n=1 Tax=unclassified Massilia TaxID=2609279 RepID=UPI0009EB385B|nr:MULTISPECIES: PAS domain S-box protein [unclassified Massilia]